MEHRMVRKRSTPLPGWNGNGKHPGGRPPVYNPEKHPKAAYKLVSRYGFTDDQLCELFGVTNGLITQWKEAHPEFLKALNEGWQAFANEEVVKALALRAKGYECQDEKIFCNTLTGEVTRVRTVKRYPPDPASMFFWLVNYSRRMGTTDWMHMQRFEHTGKDGKPIQTEDKVTQEILRKLLEKAEPEVLNGLRSSLEHIACANTDPL
jgi:hypothetical protein